MATDSLKDGLTTLGNVEAPDGSTQTVSDVRSAAQASLIGPESKIAAISSDLAAYGKKYNLRGMEDRIKRSIDPASMLAIGEMRTLVEKMAEALDAQIEDVIALTNQLHIGMVWSKSADLKSAEDPAVKVWLMLSKAYGDAEGGEDELSPQEFLENYDRVLSGLRSGAANPVAFLEGAKEGVVVKAAEKFHLEGEVPYTETDAFLSMAICGHQAGIQRIKKWQGEGFELLVASNQLDYGILSSMGLHMDAPTLERGTIFKDNKGAEVVKYVYPGLAVVLSADMEVAKKLARTGMKE